MGGQWDKSEFYHFDTQRRDLLTDWYSKFQSLFHLPPFFRICHPCTEFEFCTAVSLVTKLALLYGNIGEYSQVSIRPILELTYLLYLNFPHQLSTTNCRMGIFQKRRFWNFRDTDLYLRLWFCFNTLHSQYRA